MKTLCRFAEFVAGRSCGTHAGAVVYAVASLQGVPASAKSRDNSGASMIVALPKPTLPIGVTLMARAVSDSRFLGLSPCRDQRAGSRQAKGFRSLSCKRVAGVCVTPDHRKIRSGFQQMKKVLAVLIGCGRIGLPVGGVLLPLGSSSRGANPRQGLFRGGLKKVLPRPTSVGVEFSLALFMLLDRWPSPRKGAGLFHSNLITYPT